MCLSRLTAFTPCCRFGRVAVIVVAAPTEAAAAAASGNWQNMSPALFEANNFMHVAAVATAAATTTNNRFTHACATDFGSGLFHLLPKRA